LDEFIADVSLKLKNKELTSEEKAELQKCILIIENRIETYENIDV
jgi:hypothetical protein